MTQNAIVTRILPDSMAEVAVTRSTACGGNCGSCEACMFQSQLKAVARNTINARPGQRVCIESRTAKVFFAAMMVYVMPLVFFIIGFAISHLLGAPEAVSVLTSFVFLGLGAWVLVRTQKKQKDHEQITFEIISFL
ncbi:MAG: SoxR reducing system RseC family protein [Oscillospiraceae bacterium]|nr:SoxR reducing system RseC family protein [Oscillospiraceae bacterium]